MDNSFEFLTQEIVDDDLKEDSLEMSCSEFSKFNKIKVSDLLPSDDRFSNGPLNRLYPGSLDFHYDEKPGSIHCLNKEIRGPKVVKKLFRLIHDKLLSHK